MRSLKTRTRSNFCKMEHHESHWEIQEWNLDVRNFQIFLTGEPTAYHDDGEEREEPGVEYQMSARLIKNLNILSRLDPKRPILIHMKTCGGEWSEGMAIYDAIWACPNPVVILSYTHARSMSSIILQAATKRVLMPNSYFLFHEGTLGSFGTAKSLHSFADWDKRVVQPTMLRIYEDALLKGGRFSLTPRDGIKKMLQEQMNQKEDVYLTAQEAVDWGFADEVFDKDWQKLIEV